MRDEKLADVKKHTKHHTEVANALAAIGNPRHGEAVRKDRSSELEYFGISVPNLRRRVKEGFSFTNLPEGQVLEIWDTLWMTSPHADVLFAALEYYAPIVRKRAGPSLWPVMRRWADRVDNWAHSDGLSGIYSRLLEQYPKEVYPQLKAWNAARNEWLRRISIVSLIHFSGKNAVFLPPGKVLPLVTNCLDDDRYYVQLAVGWVLREMGHAYPDEIAGYLKINASKMTRVPSPAPSRGAMKTNARGCGRCGRRHRRPIFQIGHFADFCRQCWRCAGSQWG